MIDRYSTPEISLIWSKEYYLELLEDFVIAFIEAKHNETPVLKGDISLKRFEEIEKETKHEFASLLLHIEERLQDDNHKSLINTGLTSSDALDTVFSYQIKKSLHTVLRSLCDLLAAITSKSQNLLNVKCVGRTHGRHAQVIDFNDRLQILHEEIFDLTLSLKIVHQNLFGKISGPTGNETVPEDVISFMQEYYNMPFNTKKTTQIISRFNYTDVIYYCSLLASVIEKFCLTIRLLSIDEINEVSEGFSKNQIGSSSMPHKINPISSENLTGISRLIRSNLTPALENVSLWLERDMSHSSVERVIFPDTLNLTHYMIKRFTNIISDLQINVTKMRENIENSVSLNSAKELTELSKTMPRSEAYRIVQRKYINENSSNMEDS